MSISLNLSTHSKDLKSAYQTVIDKSSDTDWALFEYEKGTNDLKVSGTGDGGLEEISEEFEDDKVLYAFVRVMDPNTNLPKFIFISWCGESAPVRRKGLLAAHLSDVQNLLKGYHIQINARDQSDVEPAQIMKKIDEGSGAKYSYHEQKRNVQQPPVPARVNQTVPSSMPTYKRTMNQAPPAVPVRKPEPAPTSTGTRNLQSQFLDRVSSQEKERKEREEQERFEKEFQERNKAKFNQQSTFGKGAFTKSKFNAEDEELHQQLEAAKTKRGQLGGGNRDAPSVVQKEIEEQKKMEEERASLEKEHQKLKQEREEEERQQKEEERRRKEGEEQRKKEGEEQRKREAEDQRRREVDEQRRAEELQRNKEENSREQERAEEEERLRAEEEERLRVEEEERLRVEEEERLRVEEVERLRVEEEERLRVEEEERLRVEEEERLKVEEEEERLRTEEEERLRTEEEEEEARLREHQEAKEKLSSELKYEPETKANTQSNATEEKEELLTAIAIFEYQAADDSEINMKEGEMICEIQPIDEGWWQGKNEDGYVGLFPSNYVEVVENPGPMESHVESEAQDEGQHVEGVNQQIEEVNGEMPHAIALYDYEATEEGELSFLTMDKIERIEFISEEWWQGTNGQGETGLFPANYVELQE